MNVKKSLVAGIVALFAAGSAMGQDVLADAPALDASADGAAEEYQGGPVPKSYGYTVLAVGLGTPLTLPWGFDWDIFGLEANVVYSDCNKMYGLQVSGLGNVARNDVRGIQAACAFNYANRGARGAMVGAVNMCNSTFAGVSVDVVGCNRKFKGVSVDAGLSMTDSSFYGFSAAGLGSAVREDMWGWQIGLGATFARRVHGFQTGIFNMTDDLRGAQLGLVNYSATASAGFQVGLLNFIMDNSVPMLPIFNCCF